MNEAPQIALGWQNWIAGGIIERAEWDTDPGTVRLYMGERVDVERGDTIVLFRTAASVQIIDVERAA